MADFVTERSLAWSAPICRIRCEAEFCVRLYMTHSGVLTGGDDRPKFRTISAWLCAYPSLIFHHCHRHASDHGIPICCPGRSRKSAAGGPPCTPRRDESKCATLGASESCVAPCSDAASSSAAVCKLDPCSGIVLVAGNSPPSPPSNARAWQGAQAEYCTSQPLGVSAACWRHSRPKRRPSQPRRRSCRHG